MYIIGYRAGVNSVEATLAVKKHTGKSLSESKKLIDEAIKGTPISLPDDFVLREDLEEFGFKIQ